MINRRTLLKLTAGVAGSCISLPGVAARRRRHSAENFDVVIYGGSAAGVIAAVQAARMGKSAVIVNPYGFLGGMTSSGLSSADVANPASVSGLARDFFVGIGRRYGEEFSQSFEPHVAEKAFNGFVSAANAPVFHRERLDLKRGVLLEGEHIASIRMESGRMFSGKMFIDATYEGDLMMMAGVSYFVGRESNAQYGETLNGFQRLNRAAIERISDIGLSDHFIHDVDPHLVRGNSDSGLLPWVNRSSLENGQGDRCVQAYNYRLTLSDDPANQIPFDQPVGYRELDHELLLRNFEAGDERVPGRLAKIPNRKIDWNTFGAVGTDMAGASFGYAEADHNTRVKLDRLHELYTRGHFWTLAHHPRVPASVRNEMRRWGFAKDEFQRNGGFPYMIYVREGRRMVGYLVMTEQYCQLKRTVSDSIALASFDMDSHVVQYVVNERGFAEREGVFLKVCKKPYGISYRSIVPRRGECPNLLVPICVASSHVAYGSIRMEPVFMSLGQASATAASIAIDQGLAVQQVPYTQLRKHLVADQVMLEWHS
jgi:FAD dependent oxidoreductase